MEKWKIGVIALLIAGLGGFGLMQNQPKSPEIDNPPEAQSTPVANRYLGMKALSSDLPEWNNIKTWTNLQSVGGKAPTLASLKGQVALVEVFRIQCGHCSDAAPFMEKLYERYASRGLKLVAIQSPGAFDDPENVENKWGEVQKWLKQKGVKYPVGQDEKSAWFQGQVKGTHYPTMMLFGKDGVVKFAQTGHDTEKAVALAVAVEKLLPSGAPFEKRAQDLAKWLSSLLKLNSDATIQRAMTDDIAARLKTEM